jgi:hypothetical protein
VYCASSKVRGGGSGCAFGDQGTKTCRLSLNVSKSLLKRYVEVRTHIHPVKQTRQKASAVPHMPWIRAQELTWIDNRLCRRERQCCYSVPDVSQGANRSSDLLHCIARDKPAIKRSDFLSSIALQGTEITTLRLHDRLSQPNSCVIP